MKTKSLSSSRYFLMACAMLWASLPASAMAQVDREMQNLLKRGITFFQGIAMGLCVIAMIKAGLAFADEEGSHNAVSRLKKTLVGSAIVFGAVSIVQFIKSAFAAQAF